MKGNSSTKSVIYDITAIYDGPDRRQHNFFECLVIGAL